MKSKEKWSIKNIFYFILFRICILSLSIQYLNNIFLILGLDDNYFRFNKTCPKFKRLFDATAVRLFKVGGGNEMNVSKNEMNGSSNDKDGSSNDVIMNESTNDINGSANDMNGSANEINWPTNEINWWLWMI